MDQITRSGVLSMLLRFSIAAIGLYALEWFLVQMDPTNKSKRKGEGLLKRLIETDKSLKLDVSTLTDNELVIASNLVVPEDIEVSWAEIAGLDDIIEKIYASVVLPVRYRHLYVPLQLWQAPSGVLLHGPPGCGKTLIAKATAKEAGMRFINLDFAMYSDRRYAESQKLSTAVFSLATKIQPCIIFIDEIDSFLCLRKSHDRNAIEMMKEHFTFLWDGLATKTDTTIIVMGATNRLEYLDRAILRRMPAQFIIGVPNDEKRKNILDLEPDTESTNAMDKLKITDLNQFCLGEIFKHLGLKDLLSVANANIYLREATIAVFVQKYSSKWIDLRPLNKNIVKENNKIIIRDLLLIFQMLRCFGSTITKVDISNFRFGEQTSKTSNRILYYMNKYCADSLTNLRCYDSVGFQFFVKPFANVEDILIVALLPGKKCFSEIFPKLQRFHIRRSDLWQSDIISIETIHFPNLQHFEFDLRAHNSNDSNLHIINALRANQHIKSLKIHIPNFSALEEIIDTLQTIESLEVHMVIPFNTITSQFNSNLMYFNNVKRFILNFDFNTINLPQLNFLFNELMEFVLDSSHLHNKLEYNDFYTDFLSENPTIEKLTLDYEKLRDVTNPKKLQQLLPSLKEITLMDNYRIEHIIQHWTNDLKTVKRFNFGLADSIEDISKMPVNQCDQWHTILTEKLVVAEFIPTYAFSSKHIITLERKETMNSRLTHKKKFPFESKFLLCNCRHK